MQRPVSVSDYRTLAQQRLPKVLFDYVDGGSYAERTLAANVADFGQYHFRQRVMRDVSSIDVKSTMLGHPVAMPVALAPVGFTGMMARRGERQAARAAEKAKVPFTLSTFGICPIAEVREATDAPFWFQLYMVRDRKFVRTLIEEAHAKGCGALLFTVDLAVLGARYRDIRNGMGMTLSLPGRLAQAADYARHWRWAYDVGINGRPHVFGNLASRVPGATNFGQLLGWLASNVDPSVTWADIAWIRKIWPGKLAIKGILDPGDAQEALKIGADAIVVSNHGGRQLDSAPSSISALPAIVDTVGDKIELLMDGGVRSGHDVVKALALGARGVLIGRPYAYALAARGEAGVSALLATMKAEMLNTIALLGKTSVHDLGRDDLVWG
ncbi:MAG: L-lactate dehydrogenase [Alphaproteobacteria bacterium]|nr:L-lactate dehydrogenase [Alphaproteobacteria bacterium]